MLNNPAHGPSDFLGVFFPAFEHVLGLTQGLIQHQRRLSLIRVEVYVAAAERQAVRLPDCRADDNFGLQVEVCVEPLNDQALLSVLLPEVAPVRPDDCQQLADDGRDTLEVARPVLALKPGTYAAYVHLRLEARRVYLICARSEHQIDAGVAEHG